MKKGIIIMASFFILFLFGTSVSAQMMGNGSIVDDHTKQEEAEGREIWTKLQAKQTDCTALVDGDFEALGEYFMGTMMGDAHAAMNEMITRVHGEEGEEQMHAVLGKRLSGCDTSAAFPAGTVGWMPMMQMMFPLRQGFGGQGGGWMSPYGLNPMGNNTMMDYGFGYGIFSLLFMLMWWALILIGIVALIKWLANQLKSAGRVRKQ
ncbi:MAG: hypothetical protein HY617_02955 [Candidatus Sungbacteria bacterium]|nr:hypothetical protein [Candidatus Sungbacteria bacterium]